MNYKKLIAGVTALCMTCSMAACGGTEEDTGAAPADETTTVTTTEATEWTGDNIEVEALDEESTLDVDISGKTLKWLGIYDLNPTNDSPERSPELALFEDTYGAKIEYQPTTSDKRFDDLATAILGGNPPDIFTYEWRSFPYDISKNQYQPIDSLIDWEDPKWADVKDTADTFIYNGEHYIAPLGYAFNDTQVLMYNQTTIENEGLDDPYQLYLDGKWDWTAFTDMMKTFVEGSSDERYGIGGWWANAFVYTCGDTIVTYDGTTFTNNIRSEKIERAQAVIDDIFKNNLVKRGWIGGESAFVDDSLLFYSMGTWAYGAAAQSRPDDVIQIVPFPKDPENDNYYVSNKVFSYMWVKGSENGDCVKAWLDCNRTVNYDETYKQATKDKYLANNAGWTSEMYDLVMEFYDDTKFVQAYDYGYGLSTNMADTVMSTLYEGRVNELYESWITAREEYYSIVQEEVDVYNNT
ncbi:MAG: extracellular solute-binding protein [Oscillospiraceae bacterium]|nr:extracellular solute-binding protein [Oscillospiraceae bacterium]